MQRKKLLILIFVLQTCFVYPQSRLDSIAISEAQKILHNTLDSQIRESKYFIYGLDNKYIVGVTTSTHFVLYYVKQNEGIQKTDSVSLKNKLIQRVFDCSRSKNKFIYSKANKQIAHPHAKYIYFMVNNHGKKQCEFIFPGLVNTSNKESNNDPLDARVHRYLFGNYAKVWLTE